MNEKQVNDVGVRGLVKSLETLTSRWEDDVRCVGHQELQQRALETQNAVVTQLSDVIRKEIDAVTKTRDSQTGQRKKSINNDDVNLNQRQYYS